MRQAAADGNSIERHAIVMAERTAIMERPVEERSIDVALADLREKYDRTPKDNPDRSLLKRMIENLEAEIVERTQQMRRRNF